MARLFYRCTLADGLRLCASEGWRIVETDWSESVGPLVLLERDP